MAILSDAPMGAFYSTPGYFVRRTGELKKFTPFEMELDRLRRNEVILPQLLGGREHHLCKGLRLAEKSNLCRRAKQPVRAVIERKVAEELRFVG